MQNPIPIKRPNQVRMTVTRLARKQRCMSLSLSTGFYTALCMDRNGLLLAGKCEKDGSAHIEIYDTQGHLLRVIDSYNQRLRRPCSLATTGDGCVLCVDLTTDSVRKYRYA